MGGKYLKLSRVLSMKTTLREAGQNGGDVGLVHSLGQLSKQPVGPALVEPSLGQLPGDKRKHVGPHVF